MLAGRRRGAPGLTLPPPPTLVAGLIWTATLGFDLTGLGLMLTRPALGGTTFDAALGTLTFATVGLLVAARVPGNRIGWLFGALGLGFGLTYVAGEYALRGLVVAPGSLPGALWLAWLQGWSFGLVFPAGFCLLLLLFPDGHLPAPGWRAVAWAAVVASGLLVAANVLTPHPLVATLGLVPLPADNPTPLLDLPAAGTLRSLITLPNLLVLGAAGAAIPWRARRGSPTLRQQVKWMGYPIGLMLVGGLLMLLTGSLGWDAAAEASFWVLDVAALVGLPSAAAVAILRYHLYDIDLVINRTLVYGVLSLWVVGFYVLAVGYLGALFASQANLAVSLVGTGIVAVLFQPLRERLQHAVNRVLYGPSEEPRAMISRLDAELHESKRSLRAARLRLVTAREEERRRLRRDLHDGLGPELAGLAMRIGAAQHLLPTDPAAADRTLVELSGGLQTTIAHVRRLAYDLRPPALDDLGLSGALRALADEHRRGLEVLVEAPAALPLLPAALELAAYRIAQEALTNVLRHAGAATCYIRLAVVDGTLRLEVLDDGRGFTSGARVGVGLLAMRERTAELDGELLVEPRPEGGVRVCASLPLGEVVTGAGV